MKTEIGILLGFVIILIIAGIINDTERTLIMSICLSTILLLGIGYLALVPDNTPNPVKDEFAPVEHPTVPETVGPTVHDIKAKPRKQVHEELMDLIRRRASMPTSRTTHDDETLLRISAPPRLASGKLRSVNKKAIKQTKGGSSMLRKLTLGALANSANGPILSQQVEPVWETVAQNDIPPQPALNGWQLKYVNGNPTMQWNPQCLDDPNPPPITKGATLFHFADNQFPIQSNNDTRKEKDERIYNAQMPPKNEPSSNWWMSSCA